MILPISLQNKSTGILANQRYSKQYLNTSQHPNVNIGVYEPIVEIKVELKASSANLNRTQVFPTPESPISNNLKRWSYVFAIFSTKMFKYSLCLCWLPSLPSYAQCWVVRIFLRNRVLIKCRLRVTGYLNF